MTSPHPARKPGPELPLEPLVSVTARPPFLDWLPWEKILIWGLFLVAVYTLRHFFFIIFMTFILAYIMRVIVCRIALLLYPRREQVWLERALTIVCFGLFLFGLYETGNFVGPRLIAQGEVLWERVSKLDPFKEFNTIFAKTFGVILFHRKYPDKNAPEYQQAFKTFRERPLKIRDYSSFTTIISDVEDGFIAEESRKIKDELEKPSVAEKDFEEWFLAEKAPEIYEKDPNHWSSEWEKSYKSALRIYPEWLPLEELKKKPDFEQTRRDRVHRLIFADQTKDPNQSITYRKDWEKERTRRALDMLKSSPEYETRRRAFYAKVRRDNPQKYVYDYEKYSELRNAHAQGEVAFSSALPDRGEVSDKERLAQHQQDFELEQQRMLAEDWLTANRKTTDFLRDNLSESAVTGLKSLAGWIRDAIGYLVTIPVQFGLSLLLAFFITFDMPRIRRGILKLKKSRVSDFYEEITPGLYTFGRLIGRAFQAQGVIALFNTLLTFIAIRLIGIQNEVFLCGIVFVCSFIPVLGVVLSSIPIAIMALIQPGGNLFMALAVIGAILVIHFIETSILNPKILGDMLHLHPVMVLAVLALGEHFAGVWGLLLGVPVAVYVIRCVILNEEIPGLIEPVPVPGPEHEALVVAGGQKPPAGYKVEEAPDVGRVAVEK